MLWIGHWTRWLPLLEVLFNLPCLRILQLICESEKWLWDHRLDCWNPCLFSLSRFPALPPWRCVPNTDPFKFYLWEDQAGDCEAVCFCRKQVCWNVAWAGAYPQIFWFCACNPRQAESMLKACCCSKGVWFLTAVHYHFVGEGAEAEQMGFQTALSLCVYF